MPIDRDELQRRYAVSGEEELTLLRGELAAVREAMGYSRDPQNPPDTPTLIKEIRRMYLQSHGILTPIHYIGAGIIAKGCGVETITVGAWRKRYQAFPDPDAQIETLQGEVPAWLPHQLDVIKAWLPTRTGSGWRKGRPGQHPSIRVTGTVTGRMADDRSRIIEEDKP